MIKDRKVPLLLQFLIYFGLLFLLWVKVGAPRAAQRAVVTILFTLSVAVISYRCARLIRDFLAVPEPQAVMLRARWTNIYVFALGTIAMLICDAESIVSGVLLIKGTSVPGIDADIMVLACVSGFLLTWAGGYELRVANGVVDYFSLATGQQSLALSDIDHAKIEVGTRTYSDRFRPPIRLEIVPVKSRSSRPIVVNLKVFKDSDLRVLFDWLGEKLKKD